MGPCPTNFTYHRRLQINVWGVSLFYVHVILVYLFVEAYEMFDVLSRYIHALSFVIEIIVASMAQ